MNDSSRFVTDAEAVVVLRAHLDDRPGTDPETREITLDLAQRLEAHVVGDHRLHRFLAMLLRDDITMRRLEPHLLLLDHPERDRFGPPMAEIDALAARLLKRIRGAYI